MKSFLKLSIVLALAAAPTFTPSVAHAQNASTMADARFHEGMAFANAGQYEQARLAFQQAYAISKDPTTLWNLALAEMKTNRAVDAIRHFRAFKRDPKASSTDLPTCDTLINRLEAQTCRVQVKTAAGAEISVDGERWQDAAPTPGPIDVGEGVHTIRVSLGTRWATKDINGVKGQEIVITLDVGESITVLPPPHHEDHPTEPPKTEEKSVVFPPPTGAIILGGVGLVGLGLGIGFGLDSKSKSDDVTAGSQGGDCASPTSAACSALQSKNDSAKTSATIGTIGYVGGGALLAGGIVWWLVAPRKELRSGMIVPTMGPREAGISWIKGF